MNELYDIIAIFVTGGIFLVCGLMFFFIAVPGSPLLHYYRKARYMMGVACLFFIPCLIAEYLSHDLPDSNVPLSQTLTLVIASLQALLFTLALMALMEVDFPGWRYIFRRSIPALLLMTAVFIFYAFCSECCFKVAFRVLSGIYAGLLIFYTILFLTVYHQFRLLMDDYFSDNEAGRMRWVAFSFFAALSVGVMALLSALFMSTFVALLFSVVFDVFYIFFTIRFINYAHQFHTFENAMNNEPAEENVREKSGNAFTGKRETAESDVFALLDKRIEQWIAAKHFTEKGVTIEILASRFYTNRSYLSSYIKICKGKTFREWMNQLRIEEAKTLLLQHPEMTITEIAAHVGFSDKTNFRRHFVGHTGLNPKNWRNEHLSPK